MNNDYKQCVITNPKGRELIIDNWDRDKELCFEIEDDVTQRIYLNPTQVNEVVKYLTRRLNEIGELDQ